MKKGVQNFSINIQNLKANCYINFVKSVLDIVVASIALLFLIPLLAIVAILVRIELGSPIIFKQVRPGKKGKDGREKLFTLYKFRSMTDERDKDGKLMSDKVRLTNFGKLLRKTSLDELPELINILKGDMSIIGPRPLLIRDMVFMTEQQRERHNVKPGLSGWAQINGRNSILWEEKLKYDLDYLECISFIFDVKILLLTITKVIKPEDITYGDMVTSEDFGDYLLRTGKIQKKQYEYLQIKSQEIESEIMRTI